MGTASLHASIIAGGRELSSYPDRCVLQYERRTIAGETAAMVEQEMADLIGTLHAGDPDFEATARMTVTRPAYEIARDHALPQALARAATRVCGATVPLQCDDLLDRCGGARERGIPSVLFGPGGAGLHGTEEYVNVADVLRCRDSLALLVEEWCGSK